MKKKINKKKIVLLIILICLLILQIKAFTDSQANKLFEISLLVKDNSNVLEDNKVEVEATEEENSGYFYLPESVNGKRVSKFYITEKTVEENNENSSVVEKKPGDKIYLSESEKESKQVEVKLDYDTKTSNEKILYNSELNIEKNEASISVNGYVENETKLQVEEKTKDDVVISDTYLTEYGFNSVYDISLVDKNNNKINIENEKYKVTIEKEGIGKNSKKQYKILHIDDNNNVEEIQNLELETNKIIFETESFSKFVILEKEENSVINNEITNNEIIEETTDANSLVMPMSLDLGVDSWDGTTGTSFSWGSGTEEEPYLIADGEDLSYLREQVRNGNTYEGKYFQLANDIDLGGRDWTPIGTNQNSFRGIFDGAGHTIANARIVVPALPNRTYEGYGIFSSIGGGNSKTIIRNLELSNINVDITADGDTGEIDEGFIGIGASVNQDEEGLHIGTLVGSMYKNSNITNVIVNDSIIQDSGVINVVNYQFQFAVGGVVGYISNLYNDNEDPGANSRYVIDNCYSKTEISLDSTAAEGQVGNFLNRINYNGHGQYHTGGIVGTIRGQAVWPTNSLYTGNINANGLIGPIFGGLIDTSSYDTYNRYQTIWNGNNAGTVRINNMYFTNYTANGRSFTTSVQSGNSTQRISNSYSNIGYVQGVNKGIYTNDMNSMLNIFNNNSNNNKNNKYLNWIYEDGTFTFKERLTTKKIEDPENTFNIEITDPCEIENYIIRWFRDNVEDNNMQGDLSYTVPQMREEDESILVLTYDGEYYALTKFIIPKIGVYIRFNVNNNNASVTANLDIIGLDDVFVTDYTYQWYTCDAAGGDEEPIEGATSTTLNNLENGVEYKLIATNENNERWTVEDSFIYGTRTVIYVMYNGGNDQNDGYTPETPVRTLSTAYNKLDVNGTTNSNIIVLMDTYGTNSFYNQETTNIYNKPATITGRYNGITYNSVIYFYSTESILWWDVTEYRYLNADTVFQYMTWNGQGGQLYLVAQGYSVTVGEGVTMTNYDTANTNQGLIAGNAPAVHLFAGWHQYNESRLPRNNSKIVIKSGAFGRVIGGGTPGTADGQGQPISHDFMGSSKEDSFNVEITVDIENSTKGNYTYDINLLTGGSAAGNNYSNVVENIENGSVGRLIGGSIGDSADLEQNQGYPENTFLGTATINVTGGEITEVYGGCLGRNMDVVGSSTASGNTCDSYFYGTVTINVSGGRIIDNIYGAGAGGVTGYSENSSDRYKSYGQEFDTSININISGGTIIGDVYGGGYGYTEYLNANVTAQDGGSLYGDSYIKITGSPVIEGDIYGAGRGYNYSSRPNLASMEGTTTIEISGTPQISGRIFGAGAGISGYGEMAKLVGNSNVNILANLTTEVYGGGNIAKTEGNTNININSGSHTGAIYGGGNDGIIDGNTNVIVNGGVTTTIYGGGNRAQVNSSTVTIKNGRNTEVFTGGNQAKVINTKTNILGGINTNVYAGGNSADVETTDVTVNGGSTGTIYGGSNQTGTVNTSNIETISGNIGTIYGGNNIGGTTKEAVVTINGGSITSAVYGGGNKVSTNKTEVFLRKSDNQIPSVYGGGNQAGVPETNVYGEGAKAQNVFGGSNSSGTVNNTYVEINSGTYENVYGGNNQGGEVITANVVVNNGSIQNVYGGNNLGGTCNTPYVTINGGQARDVYGGGNKVSTRVTNVKIYGTVLRDVYGGGNEAEVDTNANVELLNADVGNNVYGGGNQGTITGNTNLHMKDSKVGNSLYAGGNGTSATVYGNTNLVMEGTKNNVAKNVFGGGNEAATGTTSNHSSSNVNIVGGTILGNVYGGANTSVVYGTTATKIGYDAVGDSSLEIGDINIVGTIFGGGETNAEGDEIYDFDFISVTDGIDILIDGNKHQNFKMTGSIFGSGNASSTSGESYITIKNYGTKDNPQMNISLQRANLATIINSAISLSGTTDRTNEYSDREYSISRVDEVKLKNNSTLYLQNNANLLKKFSSVVDENGTEVKANVSINEETGETSRNVDNRIYMLEGKFLNVATDEQASHYGEVSGMFFFGLFTSTTNPAATTAYYGHNYNNGDTITNEGTFILYSYVLGMHLANHNIKVDGFYTNYNEEGIVKTNYIDPIPENREYYMWTVGEAMDVKPFELSLTASKFATLGTYELPLTGLTNSNSTFIVTSISPGLENGIELVDKSEISLIEEDEERANNVFGLEMETGNIGWQSNGRTAFLNENNGTITGTTEYQTDNSGYTPTLNFSLYHAQNLTEDKKLGQVRIMIQVLTPVNDIDYEISWVIIDVNLSTALVQGNFYEAAITPGQKYGLFTSTNTTITSKSDFSTYFALMINDFSTTEYQNDYWTDERVLVSTDSSGNPYCFPENTKLTMLDMVTNKYYYYVVTADDVRQNKSVFSLNDFIAMGSETEKYNEQEASRNYYLQEQDIVYENFIFHINFADTNMTENIENNSLLMELRNDEGQILIGVYGNQREIMKYSVYCNKDATINLSGNIDPQTIYLGDTTIFNIETEFTQESLNGVRIYDTQYFDKKLGIKISVYDKDGNKLSIDSLLGVNFELDGEKYYPRVDRNNKN